jgi:hypothetical protein
MSASVISFPWMKCGVLTVIVVSNSYPSIATASTPAAKIELIKKFEFDMAGRPWRDVYTWIVERTRLPITNTSSPVGIFTFNTPKGARYTIPEIMTIVNKELHQQGYTLIRRDTFLLLKVIDD